MYSNLRTWKKNKNKKTLKTGEIIATGMANLEASIRKFEEIGKKTNETFEELERKAEELERKAEELEREVKERAEEKEWKERMEDLSLERHLEKSWNPRTRSYF